MAQRVENDTNLMAMLVQFIAMTPPPHASESAAEDQLLVFISFQWSDSDLHKWSSTCMHVRTFNSSSLSRPYTYLAHVALLIGDAICPQTIELPHVAD
jgi:hypothetical protein